MCTLKQPKCHSSFWHLIRSAVTVWTVVEPAEEAAVTTGQDGDGLTTRLPTQAHEGMSDTDDG